ncbi:MAG TPA: hypothetical protein VE046_07580 [Steroidobacteraceae bacterium]|nr:hypothetical protein [Steroidobacteraceae bacterium]
MTPSAVVVPCQNPPAEAGVGEKPPPSPPPPPQAATQETTGASKMERQIFILTH